MNNFGRNDLLEEAYRNLGRQAHATEILLAALCLLIVAFVWGWL